MNSYDQIVNRNQKYGILFIHGFIGDRSEFKEIGRPFERTHTVIYAELPGHGLRSINRDNNFESVAKDYIDLLRSQSLTRYWHVVGYSLGGRLALYMACNWPQTISRLTLISSSPGIPKISTRQSRKNSDRALAKRIENVSMRTFLSFWYRQPLFDRFHEHKNFRPTLKRRLQSDPVQLSRALKAFSVSEQPCLWGELHNLRVPIQLICGSEDSKFCSIAKEMKQQNTAIKLAVIEKVGHVVHLEDPFSVRERIFRDEFGF